MIGTVLYRLPCPESAREVSASCLQATSSLSETPHATSPVRVRERPVCWRWQRVDSRPRSLRATTPTPCSKASRIQSRRSTPSRSCCRSNHPRDRGRRVVDRRAWIAYDGDAPVGLVDAEVYDRHAAEHMGQAE